MSRERSRKPRCGSQAVGLLLGIVLLAGCRPSPSSAIVRPVGEIPVAEKPASVEPLSITYEDLDIGLQPDQEYEAWMLTTKVESFLGKRVRLTGFMSGGIFQRSNIKEFVLVKEKDCPFGKGHAHHVTDVVLREGELTSFTEEPLRVEGVLRLHPYAGPTGATAALYRLEEATLLP